MFTTFFKSLEVYNLDNLQYVGHERSYPEGDKRGPQRALNPLNELFLTLVRLRLGLLEKDLADRFGISQGLVSTIFNTWISLLRLHFSSLNFWEVVKAHMPAQFRQSKDYGNTRVIIDATEIFIQKPSDLSLQSVTWSNYKSRNTLKGLVGISPFGGVTFVSDLWAGSISDNELTEKSGLLDLLESGDNVMADKGFTIGDRLGARGVTLNILPFMQDGKMSESDVKLTRDIAGLRIHVERAIERIKILDGFIPNSISAGSVSKVFYVCAMMTNFLAPLLRPQKATTDPEPARTTQKLKPVWQ